MIGMFNILVAIIAPGVFGHLIVLINETETIRVDLERQGLARQVCRDGVTVGVKDDAKAAIDLDRPDCRHIVGMNVKWLEARLLQFKQLHGSLVGGTVNANVGRGLQPLARRWIQGRPGWQLQTVEEVSLRVAHGVLDTPLFMSFANATGADGQAVVVSEVQVARIELRRLTVGMMQDGGLTVVDHDRFRTTPKVLHGVLVAAQEVLLGLAQRELDVEHAAVAEHGGKEGELPTRRTDVDATP